jgi:RHS repeat-associated protein
MQYDALGNRVIHDNRIWIPDHNDPLKRPLIEATLNGTPVRYYIWGPGRLLGFIDAQTGELTVAHCDDFGSVVALTAADGTVLHTAHYGPHGGDWGSTGTNPTPFAWLGGWGVQKLDAPADYPFELYLTRHRLYSATHARFLSPDPLGLAGGLNLYEYAAGNPLAFIDPTGLCPSSGGGSVGGSVLDYLGASAGQLVYGNYSGQTTALGTAAQAAAGLVGLDLPGDVRDIVYDVTHWENTWSHAGQTALDVVALAPVVGAVKYADEAAALAKGSGKAAVESTQTVKVLQTGGHTFNKSTLNGLGFTKEQGKQAIEALKKDRGVPNDFHGKILNTGEVLDSSGNSLGNLRDPASQ